MDQLVFPFPHLHSSLKVPQVSHNSPNLAVLLAIRNHAYGHGNKAVTGSSSVPETAPDASDAGRDRIMVDPFQQSVVSWRKKVEILPPNHDVPHVLYHISLKLALNAT